MRSGDGKELSGKRVAAVIVAAGKGTRVGGDTPKQFRMLQGRRVVDWSIQTCLKNPLIGQIVLVLSSDWLSTIEKEWEEQSSLTFVKGGATRTESVLAGLETLQGIDYVLIHDAARPGINNAIIETVISALKKFEGVAPVLGITDTIKRVKGDVVTTVDRSQYFLTQTPQGFEFSVLYSFLKQSEGEYTDELQVLEEKGARVGVVSGHRTLAKITYSYDLDNFDFRLREQI